ncbi:methylenetetrahydrofolate--tRNA-(uracil(54)-C(5))-methyltransferase (FADH(2)-oxidizing) TrmFO [Oscillospiraceae bacterium CLA-AA-H272]|uniref:Methylenetetrahydrofolate--tRNA-(uracil-5-)-methyltransferase TrmFO n=1 Tax=Brotocaccenecus cirricatena TaxID=3064195 RepID=A0AAE3AIN1_9FIRM|nr:methylenetetrahydrofolate--tRNA-(uracil(54)-C(5))-methyltransferase (FADH(2)-oxidizing) TrmFO [Brotocaccenecus cirricatena]
MRQLPAGGQARLCEKGQDGGACGGRCRDPGGACPGGEKARQKGGQDHQNYQDCKNYQGHSGQENHPEKGGGSMNHVTVIGAGLAGSECAWQLAQRGIPVTLREMKPEKMTPAHQTADFAELCCSNSLRAAGLENAVGLLKEELRQLGSLIVRCADETAVPAGGALAVDRHGFSRLVTERVKSHPLITVIPGEVTDLPEGEVVVASGPLTSDALADRLLSMLGSEDSALHFFDAAAPLVSFDSVDMDSGFFASRYDKGTPDYINCPMEKEEYLAFWRELTHAQEAEVHGFEDRNVFEGCMPVEVMARRGEDTLRYGPLKPRGLKDPRTGREPYAVVQLRKDNADGTIYNLVGFQTHLRFPEQKRVFSMIPALHDAKFLRYGVMHRNTYLDSPRLLDRYYRLKAQPRISFAGQMTGVEGYVESCASGFLVGVETARRLLGQAPMDFPRETAIGALGLYVSNESVTQFQPMNINFGIMPPLDHRVKGKRNKNAELSQRSLAIIQQVKQEVLNYEDHH